MQGTLEDLAVRADALFYRVAALADPERRAEREAIEDEFDAWFGEAMRFAARQAEE